MNSGCQTRAATHTRYEGTASHANIRVAGQLKRGTIRHQAHARPAVRAASRTRSNARGNRSRNDTATRPGKFPEAQATPPEAFVCDRKNRRGTRSTRKPAIARRTERQGTRPRGSAARERTCATGTAAASRNEYAAAAEATEYAAQTAVEGSCTPRTNRYVEATTNNSARRYSRAVCAYSTCSGLSANSVPAITAVHMPKRRCTSSDEDRSREDERHERQRSRAPLPPVSIRDDVQQSEVEAAVRLAVDDQVAEMGPRQPRERDADRFVARESLAAEKDDPRDRREPGRQPGRQPS